MSVSQGKINKTKINEWDLIKFKRKQSLEKKFGNSAKETTNQKQPTEWEKIFANDMVNRGLISKIANRSFNSINNPSKIQAEDLNRHLSKEDIPVANRHMKRCFNNH